MKDEMSEHLDLSLVVEKAKVSPVPNDIFARCRQLEDEYDLNLADIIATDRHIGIGWVIAGLYPRGSLSRAELKDSSERSALRTFTPLTGTSLAPL